MARFQYQARDTEGQMSEGRLEAQDLRAAATGRPSWPNATSLLGPSG